jgi:hypothetical protein
MDKAQPRFVVAPPFRRRPPRLRHAAVLAVALLSGTARAQRTTFNPSIGVGAAYSSDVDFGSQGEERTSDQALTGRIILPLRHQLTSGTFRATYDADLIQYDDAKEFDDTSHRLRVDHDGRLRSGSRWQIRSTFLRTEEQLAERLLETELVPDSRQPAARRLELTDRTQRELIDAMFSYDWRVSDRWRMGAGVGFGRDRFRGGSLVADQDFYGASLGMTHTTSARGQLGWAYNYGRSESQGADEDIHRLELVLNRELTRRVGLDLRAGGYLRSPEGRSDETGTTGGVELRFNDGLTLGPVRFGFGLGVSPSTDEALIGNSVATAVGVSATGVSVEPWNWVIYAGFGRREPFDNELESTDTVTFRGELERRIRRFAGVRLSASSIDQTSDDPELERSYWRAGASVVFYPLSSTRLAGT